MMGYGCGLRASLPGPGVWDIKAKEGEGGWAVWRGSEGCRSECLLGRVAHMRADVALPCCFLYSLGRRRARSIALGAPIFHKCVMEEIPYETLDAIFNAL
jgi:hypothetical protein